MNREQDAARRRRRKAALDDLKLSRGGCADCGYNEHPAALQWDHVEPKEHGARMAFRSNWAWERILAEIAKCELVCANCHAVRTARRGYGGGAPMHGTQRPRITPGEFTRQSVERTECGRGHPLTPENLYVAPSGSRACRACQRERDKARRDRDRERVAAQRSASLSGSGESAP